MLTGIKNKLFRLDYFIQINLLLYIFSTISTLRFFKENLIILCMFDQRL